MIKLKPEQVNQLFNAVQFVTDDFYIKVIDVDKVLLNKNLFHNENEDLNYKETYNILSLFKGFKIKGKVIGEHYNDRQLVEYILYFESPNGTKTKISQLMNLCNGFEADEDEEIND